MPGSKRSKGAIAGLSYASKSRCQGSRGPIEAGIG